MSLPAEARAALAAFGLAEARAELHSHRENRVFAVQDGPRRLALRLHRPGYHGEPELQAELEFMAHLRAGGLRVPAPVAAPDGRLLVEAGGLFADLLEWLPGAPLGRSCVPLGLPEPEARALFRALGAEAARLHDAADRWPGAGRFARPAWDAGGLAGEAPLWGRFWDNPALRPEERALLGEARTRARAALAAAGPVDMGPIHGDLVRENVLVADGALALIDFDDCGPGYRLFEIATILHPNRDEPDYPALRDAVLEGYDALRPLSGAALALLPVLQFLRAASYVGWIMSRREVPGMAARERRFIERACALADGI